MLYVFLFCSLIIFTFFGFGFFILSYIKIDRDTMIKSITNFDSFLAILHYHMERAYEIIYKEKVLIYSLEGTRVNKDQFEAISKDFANLVLKMIGSTVKSSLESLYGDEKTLLFNIIEFFNNKFENDEIYKTATNNIIFKNDVAIKPESIISNISGSPSIQPFLRDLGGVLR